jgi:hypothetical protein
MCDHLESQRPPSGPFAANRIPGGQAKCAELIAAKSACKQKPLFCGKSFWNHNIQGCCLKMTTVPQKTIATGVLILT